MRRFLWGLIAVGVIAAAGASPAAADGSAFCIKGGFYDGTVGDCSFSTYQQCLATASGQAASCDANPYFNAKAEMLPDRSRLSRRKN
jgi:Protein of unknown function (DUF3551)